MIKISEIGNFFVTVGSKLDSKGFDNARKAINDIAKIGIAMGAALAAASYKAAQAAGIQERAELTLAQAMQQAGTYTKAAFEHNKDYAASLQTMTEYGDEAILGVQKMLTNFGVEGAMLDKLTKATLDLAAAKGMDLTAAADLVAKSVGSTTNALTRYGIQVEGDVGSTKRLQMAVDNISKLFGGAAEANAKTFLGAVNQLKNIFGDLLEDIGFKLLPVLKNFITLIKANIIPEMNRLINETDILDNSINKAGTGFIWFMKTIYGVVDTFNLLGTAIANVSAGVLGLLTFNIRLMKESVKGFGKMSTEMMDYGKKYEDLNTLERELFKAKEEEKTAVLTEQSEIQNELKAKDQEIDMTMLEAITAFRNAKIDEQQKAHAAAEEAKRIEDARTADAIARGILMIGELEVLTWRTGVKAFGEAMKQRLKQYIMTSQVELAAAKTVALAKAIFNSATTWGAAAWQIGVIIGQFAVAIGALHALQNFDKGGVVGGRIGQPQLAIVHGGETVIPNGGGGSGNIYVTVPALSSRRTANEYGRIIGDAIFNKVKKSRRI